MEQKRLISSKLNKRNRKTKMTEGTAFLAEDQLLDKLGEAIQKKKREKTAKKIREKIKEGWLDVHDEIKAMPFCLLQDQATKVFLCLKCNSCGITGKCTACMHRGVTHSLVDREVVTFLMKSGVKMWP